MVIQVLIRLTLYTDQVRFAVGFLIIWRWLTTYSHRQSFGEVDEKILSRTHDTALITRWVAMQQDILHSPDRCEQNWNLSLFNYVGIFRSECLKHELKFWEAFICLFHDEYYRRDSLFHKKFKYCLEPNQLRATFIFFISFPLWFLEASISISPFIHSHICARRRTFYSNMQERRCFCGCS